MKIALILIGRCEDFENNIDFDREVSKFWLQEASVGGHASSGIRGQAGWIRAGEGRCPGSSLGRSGLARRGAVGASRGSARALLRGII